MPLNKKTPDPKNMSIEGLFDAVLTHAMPLQESLGKVDRMKHVNFMMVYVRELKARAERAETKTRLDRIAAARPVHPKAEKPSC